eukprot:TRINITY_DN4151_c0_g1_i4.p1 TRINITY_DN4151_c0_g1~~TRINITY_DN4151_c0_g1_i4.p1  ORF type:complete len:620 (+),score=127.73 TRINITY_DN4151_c0_g1_i4:782-2641(+)
MQQRHDAVRQMKQERERQAEELRIERLRKEEELRRVKEEEQRRAFEIKQQLEQEKRAMQQEVEALEAIIQAQEEAKAATALQERLRREAEELRAARLQIELQALEKRKREEEEKARRKEAVLNIARIEAERRANLHSLRLLRIAFTILASLAQSSRFNLRKAKAFRSTRLLDRTFHQWLYYTRRIVAEQKAMEYEAAIKREQQSNLRAFYFYRKQALSRVWVNWIAFMHRSKQERIINEQHMARKAKIEHVVQKLAWHANPGNKSTRTTLMPQNQKRFSSPTIEPSSASRTNPGSSDSSLFSFRSESVGRTPTSARSIRSNSTERSRVGQDSTYSSSPAFEKSRAAVAKMEERRKEREERRHQLRIKYEEMERIRLEKMAQEKERQKMEIMMEKQRKQQESAAQQALVQELQREKELQQELSQYKLHLARVHYDLHKMRLCWARWLKFIKYRQGLSNRMHHYHLSVVLRNHFTAWKSVWVSSIKAALSKEMIQTEMALEHRRRRLLRFHFHKLRQDLQQMRYRFTMASRIVNRGVLSRFYRFWLGAAKVYLEKQALAELKALDKAETYSKRILSRHYLRRWVEFVSIAKEEKQKEHRLQQLRLRVKSVIPDYQSAKEGE